MVSDDVKKIAKVLGLEINSGSQTTDQFMSSHQQMIKDSSTKDGAPKPTQAQLLGNAHTQKAMVSVTDNPRDTGKPSIQEELDTNPGKRAVLALYTHFMRGILAFRSKLQQTWKHAPDYPPRGSLLFQGLVSVESAKARALFDVNAYWDPKTKKWDGRSTRITLKRLEARAAPALKA